MAYSGVLQDVRTCSSLGIPSRVPYFPIHVMYDYYHFGCSHRDFRDDPDTAVDIAKKAVKTFDYDWYLHHPDDLVEYEDFGMEIRYEEHIPPAVYKYRKPDSRLFKDINVSDNIFKKGRLAKYLQGIRALKKQFGETVCVTGRVAAPFSSLSLIAGIEDQMFLMLEEPSLLRTHLEFLTDFSAIIALAELAAGADALWVGDCTATSHFISPDQYKEFAHEPAAAVLEQIRKAGGISFYHGGECSIPHLQLMAELPCDALNIGYGVDFSKVKKALAGKKCIMGNLDTIKDLQPADSAAVDEAVRIIIESGKPNGGYIFCTGEGIVHNTPMPNMAAMAKAVRKYGAYI